MSEWISVNINDRYAVNRVGEVKNLETNKKLNPSFNKAGYRVVNLGISADEAHRQRKTSRAMCTNNYPLVDMGITRSDCIHIINPSGMAGASTQQLHHVRPSKRWRVL